MLCLFVGVCRMLGTLEQTSPPDNLNVQNASSPDDLYRTGVDTCGPRPEQLRAAIKNAWQQTWDFSMAMSTLVLLLSFFFIVDCVMRFRRDCFNSRVKFNPWQLLRMPTMLMVPKLAGAWTLFFLFRFGHVEYDDLGHETGRAPVYPNVDTVVVNKTSGRFFKFSETVAAIDGAVRVN